MGFAVVLWVAAVAAVVCGVVVEESNYRTEEEDSEKYSERRKNKKQRRIFRIRTQWQISCLACFPWSTFVKCIIIIYFHCIGPIYIMISWLKLG